MQKKKESVNGHSNEVYNLREIIDRYTNSDNFSRLHMVNNESQSSMFRCQKACSSFLSVVKSYLKLVKKKKLTFSNLTNSLQGKPSKIKQQQPNISLPHGCAGSFD